MKIKNVIYCVTSAYILLVIVLGFALRYSTLEIVSAVEKNELAGEISKKLFELNMLTQDHLFNRSERSYSQWKEAYSALDIHIRHDSELCMLNNHKHTEEELRIINSLYSDYKVMGRLFSMMNEPEISEQLQEKISLQLVTKSLDMGTQVSIIAQTARSNIISAKNRTQMFNAIFIPSLLLLMVFGFYVIWKDVIRAVKTITKGANNIGRGDLKTAIEYDGNNEISDLVDSINEMRKNLDKITASRDELNEKIAQYYNLANSSSALIWTAGTDKLCNYFNNTWLNFTGRTTEQEEGNGWAEGVHPDDFDRCLKTYVTAFDKREKFEMEYRLRNAKGEYRWLLDIGTPNYDAKGEFVGYIGHCFDIDDKVKSDAEQKKKNEEMRQMNKLMIDRELKMVALKNEINDLLKETGKEPKY